MTISNKYKMKYDVMFLSFHILKGDNTRKVIGNNAVQGPESESEQFAFGWSLRARVPPDRELELETSKVFPG